MAIITGTEGDDHLTGTAGGDIMRGLAGDDTLNGSYGFDSVYGGEGDDRLFGSYDNDTLVGGSGADFLNGGPGSDAIWYDFEGGVAASAGVTVDLAAGTGSGGDAEGDTLAGIESVYGTRFADTLIGDDAANNLTGNGGADHLVGGGGSDALQGSGGVLWLEGGAGNDSLTAGQDAGGSLLDGGPGDDTLAANTAGGIFIGGDGLDVVRFGNFYGGPEVGVAADLTAAGGPYAFDGVENMSGSLFGDELSGDGGRNRLEGIDGDDRLLGRAGHDVLDGGAGDDWLEGGAGNDFLRGGAGADSFAFDVEASSRDRIVDFDGGEGDRLFFTPELQAYSGITDFDSFLQRASDTEDGLLIHLEGNHPWPLGVLMTGIDLAGMTPDDLIFG
jgi:Ca2+-binding RTX toxin-like protein